MDDQFEVQAKDGERLVASASLEELRRSVLARRVPADAQARRVGGDTWVPIGEVVGMTGGGVEIATNERPSRRLGASTAVPVGTILGLVVARLLVFDKLDAAVSEAFVRGLLDGHPIGWSVAFNSAAFWKAVACGIAGGVAGGRLGATTTSQPKGGISRRRAFSYFAMAEPEAAPPSAVATRPETRLTRRSWAAIGVAGILILIGVLVVTVTNFGHADRFAGEWTNSDRNFDSFVIERVAAPKYKLTLNGDDYGYGVEEDGELQFRLVFATAYLRREGDELICRYDGKDQFRLKRGGAKSVSRSANSGSAPKLRASSSEDDDLFDQMMNDGSTAASGKPSAP